MKTPRGIRNNNPGNIRKSPAEWLGETDGADDAFETFSTPELGIRALAKILLNYQRRRRLRTVEAIISRWAPPNENDTDAYAAAVSVFLGVSPDDVIDLEDVRTLRLLTTAIIRHENGGQFYTDKTIDDGVRLALA